VKELVEKGEDAAYDDHPSHTDHVQDVRGQLFHNIVVSLMSHGDKVEGEANG